MCNSGLAQGSEVIKLDLDLTFEPENSEVTDNSVEIKEPLTETPIINLVYTATSSSSSSSSISCSSSYSLPVKTSSSKSSSSSYSSISSSSSSALSSFFTHHSSSSSSSSAYTPTVCDGCNCPQEFILDPDDSHRQGGYQFLKTKRNFSSFSATASPWSLQTTPLITQTTPSACGL